MPKMVRLRYVGKKTIRKDKKLGGVVLNTGEYVDAPVELARELVRGVRFEYKDAAPELLPELSIDERKEELNDGRN
jgi:hypothetical protein